MDVDGFEVGIECLSYILFMGGGYNFLFMFCDL